MLFPRSHENRKQLPHFVDAEPVRAGWGPIDPLTPYLHFRDEETRPREERELAGSSHSCSGSRWLSFYLIQIFVWNTYLVWELTN